MTKKEKVVLFIKKISGSPKISLIFGILLLLSGIFESFDTVIEKFLNFHIRLHHGVILFAFFHIISALDDVIQGIEYTKDSKKQEKKEKEVY